jgi:hypothetical protein
MFHELEQFGGRIGACVEQFVKEGKQELEQHVTEHQQPLFGLLREVKPGVRSPRRPNSRTLQADTSPPGPR